MSDSFYRSKTALVTGASSGIGAEVARQLGAAGARVLLVARRAEALAAVAADVERAGGTAAVFAADLEPPGAAADLVRQLDGETVDVLVNNAGFGVRAALVETDPGAIDGMVGLNVLALTQLTRLLLPGMVERGSGGVLTVASIAAVAPAPHFAVYAATKAYVLSFTEALWGETRATGVRVSCLCPGPVPTEFGGRSGVGPQFFRGGTSAEAVARAGLAGLAAGRRRVVPGLWNRVRVAAANVVPQSVVVRVAGAMMRRAG